MSFDYCGSAPHTTALLRIAIVVALAPIAAQAQSGKSSQLDATEAFSGVQNPEQLLAPVIRFASHPAARSGQATDCYELYSTDGEEICRSDGATVQCRAVPTTKVRRPTDSSTASTPYLHCEDPRDFPWRPSAQEDQGRFVTPTLVQQLGIQTVQPAPLETGRRTGEHGTLRLNGWVRRGRNSPMSNDAVRIVMTSKGATLVYVSAPGKQGKKHTYLARLPPWREDGGGEVLSALPLDGVVGVDGAVGIVVRTWDEDVLLYVLEPPQSRLAELRWPLLLGTVAFSSSDVRTARVTACNLGIARTEAGAVVLDVDSCPTQFPAVDPSTGQKPKDLRSRVGRWCFERDAGWEPCPEKK